MIVGALAVTEPLLPLVFVNVQLAGAKTPLNPVVSAVAFVGLSEVMTSIKAAEISLQPKFLELKGHHL